MSLSRNLNLSISLSGFNTIKSQLSELQSFAQSISSTLSNISINVGNSVNTSLSNVFNTNSLKNVDVSIPNLSDKKLQLQNEVNGLYNVKFSGTSNLRNSEYLQDSLIKPIDTTINNLALKKTDIESAIKNVSNIDLASIANSNNVKVLGSSASTGHFATFGTSLEQNSNVYSQVNSEYLQKLSQSLSIQHEMESTDRNLNKYAQNQVSLQNQWNTLTKDTHTKLDATRSIEEQITEEEKKQKTEKEALLRDATELSKQSAQLVQTGFGLHIAQIYIAPILYGLEQISSKMMSVSAQFDKLYTDYQVKSEEFGSSLSKNDFFSATIGQTYGLEDAASTAERFAASGIDVSKSQQALTDVMQVATSADMDYTTAANGVIQTLAGMHLQVSDTTKVTDALINSANASTAELSDLVDWFQYSASAAYQMGMSINQLSAYLGILSSSGTPQTGAAMRQLLIQLSKESVQQAFSSKYSFLKPSDFTDISSFITKMREYIQSSKDQNTTTLEATRLLGGRANAEQALRNLMQATPELWNQVTSAVNKTGTTQDLYNKVTNNTADAIKRIQNDINILLTQMGQAFGPIIKVAATVVTGLTSTIVALPGPVKTAIGVAILLATVFTGIIFTAMGVVGALAIIKGSVDRLTASEDVVSLATRNWSATLVDLLKSVWGIITGTSTMQKTVETTTVSMDTASTAATTLGTKYQLLSSVATIAGGLLIGYAATSALTQKAMWNEAYVVAALTDAYLTYNAVKAAGSIPGVGPIAALAVGGLVATGYGAFAYNQIETAKRDAKLAAFTQQTGIGSSTVTNYNYKTNKIANLNVSTDGMDMDTLNDMMDSQLSSNDTSMSSDTS